MKSPYCNTDSAFSIFYDEPVSISCKHNGKNIKQTINCCVFSGTTGEPISDEQFETDRKDLNFICDRKDYKYVTMLTRGDTIERLKNTKYKRFQVQDIIEDETMGLVIVAWSV